MNRRSPPDIGYTEMENIDNSINQGQAYQKAGHAPGQKRAFGVPRAFQGTGKGIGDGNLRLLHRGYAQAGNPQM